MNDSRETSSTPRDVFLHLLSAATLYVSAASLLTLFFQYINYWFRDPLNPVYISGPIRWAIASLIIIFPAHILAARYINRVIVEDPARREGKLRKWLLYFTLFVAAITLIGDLVALIFNFLDGELSARFYLKVLAVAVVAGGVFLYYWWDLKRAEAAVSPRARGSFWAAALVIAAAVVGSFFVIGSPFVQREVRFDQRRVNDLQTLQFQAVNYWQQKNALPESLEDLQDSISGFAPPTDPATNESYEYRRVSPLSFELCAVFSRSSDEDPNRQYDTAAPYPVRGGENWRHAAGRQCFERTIDPDLYPPREPKKL